MIRRGVIHPARRTSATTRRRVRRAAIWVLIPVVLVVGVLLLWPDGSRIRRILLDIWLWLTPTPALRRAISPEDVEQTLNALVFVPVFCGTQLLLPRIRPALWCLAAVALACSVELTQLLFLSGRKFDPVDACFNSLGGILGVGRGSHRPPRLVVVDYRPEGAGQHMALVGKGITFDSGGLSLKPGTGMMTMKSDMAGAAAVLNAVAAAAELRLPLRVTGYLCLAENLPGGGATRPEDVLVMRGGTTVEVLNTDAEGRLVMADGLAYASEQSPDCLLDVATLTGAQVVALGERYAAVMGEDSLREAVAEAGAEAGEPFWPMPLPEELRAGLKSPVADLKNIGAGRAGGMLTAGLFLQRFVGQVDGQPIPWAHLDIAGPSFNEGSEYGFTPKQGTGVAVRTLITLAERIAAA